MQSPDTKDGVTDITSPTVSTETNEATETTAASATIDAVVPETIDSESLDDNNMQLGDIDEDEMKELLEEFEDTLKPNADEPSVITEPARVDVDTTDSLDHAPSTSSSPPQPPSPSVAAASSVCNGDEFDMLDRMCTLCTAAIDAHTALLEAEDARQLLQGDMAFVPSTSQDHSNVEIVQEAAQHLPFLFTEREAQGYLPYNVADRWATIAKAHSVRASCDELARELESR